MPIITKRVSLSLGVLICAAGSLPAATIQFSGDEWTVRSAQGWPGPNALEENNVWLDGESHPHIEISDRDGKRSCAEVTTRVGFQRP